MKISCTLAQVEILAWLEELGIQTGFSNISSINQVEISQLIRIIIHVYIISMFVLFKNKEKANFLRTVFHDFTEKMVLKDIELVRNVTNLKSPFKKNLIYNTQSRPPAFITRTKEGFSSHLIKWFERVLLKGTCCQLHNSKFLFDVGY